MGRMIEVDVDKLKELLNENKIELTNNIISIVRENYIPKANYEIRLKADMVAMLTELQLDIEECVDGGEGSPQFEEGVAIARTQVVKMIQQKINKLKEENNGNR